MKVHTHRKNRGIALLKLNLKFWVLAKNGRKIASRANNEESNRVRRIIAARICTIILSYL